MISQPLSLPFDNINWTELYLTAEATNELFQDVHIVTTQSEYAEQIRDTLSGYGVPPISDDALTDAIDSGNYFVQEAVTVGIDGLRVCINASTIDDEVTFRALDMVASALDRLNGERGTIFFGDPMTFTVAELPWLTKH